MLSAALLLVALAGSAAILDGDEEALVFAWGDVFAADAAGYADQLAFGLGLGPVGDDLTPFGARGELGEGYRLSGGGADPVHFIVAAGSPATWDELFRVQTLVVVENDATGGADWEAWSRVLHVVRPAGAPLAPELVGGFLERLVAGTADPYPSLRLATDSAQPPWVGLPQHVLAYGLSRSDVRPGKWTAAGGRERSWAVTRVEQRTQRVLLDLGLDDPTRAARFAGSFEPAGVDGLRLVVRDDDTYDAPGIDLGRAGAYFEFDSSVEQHVWVGGTLDLRAGTAARDLSRPGVELHLSTAGRVSGPEGHSGLFLALIDAEGVEAHLPIDLDEITSSEQEVALPLDRFTQVTPALDLSRLVELRVGVRDEAAGRASAAGGSIAVLDPRFVLPSPARLSPVNTFWSNEPVVDSSPDKPLSNGFLAQPATVYKYFHGIGGADPADTAAIIANVAAIRANGLTPHVTLELWPNTTQRVLDRVLAGDYDPFFRTLFGGLAEVGGRVELAPFHEGNAGWYPWEGASDPGKLRAVFRRVGRLRDEVRAHNVALGYVVICLPSDPSTLAHAVAAFPGEEFVDYVGLQGFESGYGTDSITFNELFTASAAILRRLTDLPFAVTEYGFSPKAGAQHEKATLAALSLGDVVEGRTPVPLTNLMYFNVAKTENGAWRDWRYAYDDGSPVPEIAPHFPGLTARAGDPTLRTAGLGRDAYERRLRAHTRVALRLD